MSPSPSHATNITQKLSLSRKNSNKPFKSFCKFLFGVINTKSLGRRRRLKTVIKLTEVKVLKSKLTPLRQQNTTVYILCSSECCEVFATLCNSFYRFIATPSQQLQLNNTSILRFHTNAMVYQIRCEEKAQKVSIVQQIKRKERRIS